MDKKQTVIKHGDKVRLNPESIYKSNPNPAPKYKEWIEANKDVVFTAEQYREKDNLLFCLREDESELKWTFFYTDLLKVEDGDCANE